MSTVKLPSGHEKPHGIGSHVEWLSYQTGVKHTCIAFLDAFPILSYAKRNMNEHEIYGYVWKWGILPIIAM